MEPTNTLDRKGDSGATGGPPPTGSGLMQDAQLLWQELRAMAHDQLTLAVLETRLAGKSLVTMIAAAVMVAVLLVSAWLGLMGAAILGLVSIGVIASIAMLLAVAANLVFVLILYGVIRRQRRHLGFPATLRSLRPPKLRGSDKP